MQFGNENFQTHFDRLHVLEVRDISVRDSPPECVRTVQRLFLRVCLTATAAATGWGDLDGGVLLPILVCQRLHVGLARTAVWRVASASGVI